MKRLEPGARSEGVPAPRVDVVFIAGGTRAGSTFLDRFLGSDPDASSLGEFHYFWERGLGEGRLCGCGAQVDSCEFWQTVLHEVMGPEPPPVAEIVAAQEAHLRTRNTLGLMAASWLRRKPAPRVRMLAELTQAMYVTAADVAGTPILIDSSKRPSDAVLLTLMPQVRPTYVHLVRDPRGVAFSWQRRKRETDVTADRRLMPQRPMWESTTDWLAMNGAAELARWSMGPRALTVRYEDLVEDPSAVARRVFEQIGRPFHGAQLVDGRLRLGSSHMVGGNPNRFDESVKVQPDVEWQSGLGRGTQASIALLTAPLSLRYRYRLRETRETASR